MTPELLSTPGTDRSWQGKGDMVLQVLVATSFCKARGKALWLIKSASPLVGEHSKCGKINKNKSMYVKSAPCHFWPSPPAELQEPFSCWFVLFAHRSPHTVMWYKVICVPGAAAGKSSLELAEGQCGAGLKSDLCLVTAQEMLVLILGWQKLHNPLHTSSLLIPCELSKWSPDRLQSEKKNSNMFWRALKEFYFLHSLQATAVLICLSIHFLFAGTFTLYLAHFKRTTRLYRQKITQ